MMAKQNQQCIITPSSILCSRTQLYSMSICFIPLAAANHLPAALPINMVSMNSNALPSANKAYNLASRLPPSSLQHVGLTLTLLTTTRSFVLTTLLSSFAAEAPSSEVAQCKLRWRKVGNCSSTCLLLCVIIWLVLTDLFLIIDADNNAG